MPSYRTTSLFHYTKSIDTMFAILKQGRLKPNYCSEDLSYTPIWNGIDYKGQPPSDFILGIPMICFCDIPILSAGDFLENYGHYCIAFDKEWGIRNGCNPVQYVCNTRILESLSRINCRVNQLREIEEKEYEKDCEENEKRNIERKRRAEERRKIEEQRWEEELKDANNWGRPKIIYPVTSDIIWVKRYRKYFLSNDKESLSYYLGFLKKYMSEWQGKPYENYKENEWRYIVEESDSIKWMNKDEYKKWRGYIENPKPYPSVELKKHSLKFSPSDIHHIILYEESEIPVFIRWIRYLSKIGDTVLDTNTKDILISKINSFERIQNDY